MYDKCCRDADMIDIKHTTGNKQATFILVIVLLAETQKKENFWWIYLKSEGKLLKWRSSNYL